MQTFRLYAALHHLLVASRMPIEKINMQQKHVLFFRILKNKMQLKTTQNLF